jgi:hypothetical protein
MSDSRHWAIGSTGLLTTHDSIWKVLKYEYLKISVIVKVLAFSFFSSFFFFAEDETQDLAHARKLCTTELHSFLRVA